MKIELSENRVLFKNGSSSQEIHPFWLRERVTNEEYFDNNTQQRKFDPTFLKTDVEIKLHYLLDLTKLRQQYKYLTNKNLFQMNDP